MLLETNKTLLINYHIVNTAEMQPVHFTDAVDGRYLKITMKEAHDGNRFAAMAEISPFYYE